MRDKSITPKLQNPAQNTRNHGGSNAIGTFYPFENDGKVKLYGVEAGGEGIETGKHAASLGAGAEGVSKAEHVRRIIQSGADGVIVGSAFVNIIHKYTVDISKAVKALEKFARELKDATKQSH